MLLAGITETSYLVNQMIAFRHQRNRPHSSPAYSRYGIDSSSYYGTLFHELVHSSGHTSRLNRKEVMENNRFGSESYAMEELTVEIGASYLKSLMNN